MPSITRRIDVSLNDCPNGVLMRKEYRDMSFVEWNTFKDALLSLQSSPSPDGGKYSEWDWLTRVHLDYVPEAHDHPAFLPWHRLFLGAVEKRLQRINSSIVIPYWDWSYDWASPLRSPIFSAQYGIDVNVRSRGDCRYQRQFPQSHCLVRNYNPRNFTAFYPSETIDAMIQSARDYNQIRERIEFVPHGIVHAAIGGSGGDMTEMHSPNDPIFWLHHSNVDRLWWQWQHSGIKRRRHSQSLFNPLTDYGGRANDGSRVSITDTLRPFQHNVNSTFWTESLCYSYAPFSKWSEVSKQARRKPHKSFFQPDQIPESWIRAHGMPMEKLRSNEKLMSQIMSIQAQQPDPSKVNLDDEEKIIVAQ